MPRYFFHTVDGGRSPDREGVELPDPMTARVEAVKLAGAIIADEPRLLANGSEFALQVSDETKQPLFTLKVAVMEDGATLDA